MLNFVFSSFLTPYHHFCHWICPSACVRSLYLYGFGGSVVFVSLWNYFLLLLLLKLVEFFTFLLMPPAHSTWFNVVHRGNSVHDSPEVGIMRKFMSSCRVWSNNFESWIFSSLFQWCFLPSLVSFSPRRFNHHRRLQLQHQLLWCLFSWKLLFFVQSLRIDLIYQWNWVISKIQYNFEWWFKPLFVVISNFFIKFNHHQFSRKLPQKGISVIVKLLLILQVF